MIIRQGASTPYYDPILDASKVSVKVNYGGVMKHKPTRHYVGGSVQLIDHVDVSEMKLSHFKTMAEMCGYDNDSVVFWLKFGKFGDRLKLVSTDVEANFVSKSIPKNRIIEVCFEHLDSYIGKDVRETFNGGKNSKVSSESQEYTGGYDKEAGDENSSNSTDFEDPDNDFWEHRYEVDEEVRRKMTHEEGDTDCVISEEFMSLESDSNSENLNFPKFNVKTDWLNPVLALELTFGNKKEFIQAVVTHEVNQGRYIKWHKNDKERARAVCSNPDCEWEIMASRMYRDMAFQIKTYNSDHSCKNWNHSNNKITSSFIARRYLDEIRTNRDWKISEFRDQVSVQLRAHVTSSKCRRAKKKALAIIDGDINENYKVLWNYCNEIVRTNPNTSIYIKLVENEVPNKPERFQRFYICFGACKEGFKSGCRKIVGVDGCWLKGPMYGSQLLTAIGLDSNNNIFPIAYAIVEKERRESWSWFLNHLKLDLEIDDEASWTFMSDKQKGLIEAFNEVLPFVSHRFCVRHLHNNFKRAGFSGNTLRDALWKAAGATASQLFDVRMVEIFDLDPEAANWLEDKSPSEWSRSHFLDNVKCDTLLNNMCECFNSMILDARDKPIITLLEKIRYLLMERMQANRDKASKWRSDDICPRIKDVLYKNQAAAAEYIPKKSNQWNYELIGRKMDKWAVDLLNRKCSCRKWDLTGIPCKHAIGAIWAKNDDINSYVDDCYKVETYRRIYSFAILPMNGQNMWPKSEKIPPLPPRIVRQSTKGRKQKLRRKEADEVGASRTKMRRKQKTLGCSLCHNLGHNKRTCKYNLERTESQMSQSSFTTESPAHTKLPVRRAPDNQSHLHSSEQSEECFFGELMQLH